MWETIMKVIVGFLILGLAMFSAPFAIAVEKNDHGFSEYSSSFLLMSKNHSDISKNFFNTSSSAQWIHAWGNLCSGVMLYYGSTPENRMFVGEVLGGNDNYIDSITGEKFRGVKIRTKSGALEWKDRDRMVADERWSVKTDDPALKRCDWKIYIK